METIARQSRKQKSQGMNWISQHRRLAIYLRDGLACAYCGSTVESGAKLTLDHLTPYSMGGSNASENLVTCCHKCNSSRGNRSVLEFAGAVGEYLNIPANQITAHVYGCAGRTMDLSYAKKIIDLRGSCFKAISSFSNEENL